MVERQQCERLEPLHRDRGVWSFCRLQHTNPDTGTAHFDTNASSTYSNAHAVADRDADPGSAHADTNSYPDGVASNRDSNAHAYCSDADGHTDTSCAHAYSDTAAHGDTNTRANRYA